MKKLATFLVALPLAALAVPYPAARTLPTHNPVTNNPIIPDVPLEDRSQPTPQPTPQAPQPATQTPQPTSFTPPTHPPKHPNTQTTLSCGLAPERSNDFFWENDKFGMRAYGPGDDHVWSGLDLFNKMPDAGATCGEVLHNHTKCGNWHAEPYKGILDNYAVGAGRGVGGVAVFGDGEWKTYANWSAYRIIEESDTRCVFELDYAPFSLLGKMTYRITIEKGSRFFRNDVTFEAKHGMKGFKVGPGLDFNAARGHAGEALEGPGLVALFEDSRGEVQGSTATAIVIDPKDAKGVRFETDHQGSRILLVNKPSFTYYAGAAWSKAGEITTADEWFKAVKDFRKELEK